MKMKDLVLKSALHMGFSCCKGTKKRSICYSYEIRFLLIIMRAKHIFEFFFHYIYTHIEL